MNLRISPFSNELEYRFDEITGNLFASFFQIDTDLIDGWDEYEFSVSQLLKFCDFLSDEGCEFQEHEPELSFLYQEIVADFLKLIISYSLTERYAVQLEHPYPENLSTPDPN
jgi:hypothetical protein